FERSSMVFSSRQAEADEFYRDLFPAANDEDHRIARQALAGMIWSKQFFHYDVERWLKGDLIPPPAARRHGRNAQWKHLKAADVISMPDAWEYSWFAAWDLAFHCGARYRLGYRRDGVAARSLDAATTFCRGDRSSGGGDEGGARRCRHISAIIAGLARSRWLFL